MACKIQPKETETMTISSKNAKPYQPPLNMNNEELHVAEMLKHLGVYFSYNGLWNFHVDYIVQNSYKRLNIHVKENKRHLR